MRIIKILLLALATSFISSSTFAYEKTQILNKSSYTIYLVRHAEKQSVEGEKNAELTQCGTKRAIQLASILENVELAKVYSTNYKRTMATAKPTTQQKKLAITNYDPRVLADFSKQLMDEKQNALVVGHSNTTPQLVALLSEQTVKELTELDYQELYQIQVIGKERILTRLKQPLKCDIK